MDLRLSKKKFLAINAALPESFKRNSDSIAYEILTAILCAVARPLVRL